MYTTILVACISAVAAVGIYAVVTNLVAKTSIRKRREAAAAANWQTSPMLEAFEACPPVLEYISVSNTITFTFSPEASTWSRPPKPIS